MFKRLNNVIYDFASDLLPEEARQPDIVRGVAVIGIGLLLILVSAIVAIVFALYQNESGGLVLFAGLIVGGALFVAGQVVILISDIRDRFFRASGAGALAPPIHRPGSASRDDTDRARSGAVESSGDPALRVGHPTDSVPSVDRRPLWLAAPGIALYLIGSYVGWSSVPNWGPAGQWSWWTTALFLYALALIFLLVIPGVLIALGTRWGAAFLSLVGPRLAAHPRLAGLALAWFGLTVGCMIGWLPFLPLTATTRAILGVIGVFAFVPLARILRILLSDRSRKPADG